jgi:hypothetical protein
MNISARDASIEDCIHVLNLRNQHESIAASRNPSEITMTEHESWFKTDWSLLKLNPFGYLETQKM